MHSFLQLTKLQERNSECLIFEKGNYASCHQLGKHVIYLISIKLEQFVIWRVALEPWTSLVKDYIAPGSVVFHGGFLQIQVGQINLCSPIKLLCKDIVDKRLMDFIHVTLIQERMWMRIIKSIHSGLQLMTVLINWISLFR